MCIESQAIWNGCNANIEEGSSDNEYNSKKSKATTYSIKKVLKMLFKKTQQKRKEQMMSHTTSTIMSTSLESLENIRNMQVEDHYEEIEENAANEKLLSCIYDEFVCQQNISNYQQQQQRQYNCDEDIEEEDNDDVFVPVRYARTEAGTFFWTTSLRMVDTDLIQPVYCSTSNQFPVMQFQLQDRWAQA